MSCASRVGLLYSMTLGIALLAGCGGSGGGGSSDSAPSLEVELTPSSKTVQVGSTQELTATVLKVERGEVRPSPSLLP